MARSASGGLMTFGIINILVALMPMCAGCVGSFLFLSDEPMPIELPNRGGDIGPQMKQHLDREVPHAKAEAFAHAGINIFLCGILIIGAVGLFMAQSWARWLTIATAMMMILAFCVHDIYQFAIYRPAMMEVFDQNMPPGAERDGFKFGFTGSYFFWSCFNPVLMIYLVAMSVFLLVTSAFDANDEADRRPRRRRGRWDEDDDDDDDY